MERVTIPRGVTEIASDAFRGWSALREVVFAENSCLKKIGRGAFRESGLEKFSAPVSLKTLTQKAFYGCARDSRG